MEKQILKDVPEEKRKRLEKAIRIEGAHAPEYNSFGEKTNMDDYAHTNWYLSCGEYEESDLDNNELLDSVVNDFDSVYADYFG